MNSVFTRQYCINDVSPSNIIKKNLKQSCTSLCAMGDVRWRWPTRKYSRCWRTTCWVLYYINSWHFISAIWSLDWKLKSCGVNILINLDCKYLESQDLKVSDFVFDLSECYWRNQDPEQWELFLLLACRALFFMCSLAHLHFKWLWARCLPLMCFLWPCLTERSDKTACYSP